MNLSADGKFKRLLNSVSRAFKKLYKNGKYEADDLKETKEFKDVITDTNSFLSRSLEDNKLSPSMRKSLREDIFYFSGFKTHAQLYEASRNLRTGDGQLKSFEQFKQDTAGIKENYNTNYLEAEYDFAKGSVLMAERWERFSDDDRYALQYRTAGDDRVRETHRELNRITRPKDDPFWDQYFPPNGWRCRCTAVQVLRRNNDLTDAANAKKKGERATSQINKSGQNKLQIFRFNVGRQKVVFPPEHPYRKVQDADRARPGIYSQYGDFTKKQQKAKDKEVKEWAKENIPEGGLERNLSNFKTGKVVVHRKSIKSISNHLAQPYLKDIAKEVVNELPNCKFIATEPLFRDKKNYEAKKKAGITEYSYYSFEFGGQKFRLNMQVIDDKFEKPYSVNFISK